MNASCSWPGWPRWLSAELLRLLERQGRVVGIVYLLHFDQPIGDLHNPRGFASHYTGWTWTWLPGWSTTPPAAAPG